jgi:iron complex outermembrane receptor protein
MGRTRLEFRLIISLRAAPWILACLLGPTVSVAQEDPSAAEPADLTSLSLDELVNLQVTTVSRKPERLWSAPSGIDVITGEDIRRSGARSLPDALRLATGVHVGQPSARTWAVSVRGMNVIAANKISVVIDGRSAFTPFFSGVQWDAQDTLIEDVDRIEVVRGPVGALWGAYAVNGFIQVLTKPAGDTPGWLLTAGTGSEDPVFVGARYGGALGKQTPFRVYAKYFQTDWTYLPSGEHAQGATDFFQTGFRLDAQRSGASGVTVQGDYYTNQDLPLDRPQAEISGGNLLGRWRRPFASGAELTAEAYFDHTYRLLPAQFEESRSTGSTSLRYRFDAGRHGLLIGADALVSGDEIGNIGVARLEPPERTIYTAGLYVQDLVQLSPRAAVVLGAKAEQGSFAGLEIAPSARFLWTGSPRTTAWAAVSRAVRTPVRIDEDLVFQFNGLTLFEANDDFETETAWAYELGVRHRPVSSLTFDLSAFVYRYNRLRSTEPLGAALLPQTFKNMLDADSFGGEATVMYQPHPRLSFKGSYRFLDLDFARDEGSRDTTGGSQEGNDARHVGVLAAHADLPGRVELDAFLRLASDLPRPALDGYTTLDARVAWRPVRRLEVALVLRNLLDEQFAEFVTTNSLNEEVHRSATVKLTWRP